MLKLEPLCSPNYRCSRRLGICNGLPRSLLEGGVHHACIHKESGEGLRGRCVPSRGTGGGGAGWHAALQLTAWIRDVRPALLPVGLGGWMGGESAVGETPRGFIWVPHAGSAGPPG